MEGKPINILLVEDEEAHAVNVKRNLNDFKLANKISPLMMRSKILACQVCKNAAPAVCPVAKDNE